MKKTETFEYASVCRDHNLGTQPWPCRGQVEAQEGGYFSIESGTGHGMGGGGFLDAV